MPTDEIADAIDKIINDFGNNIDEVFRKVGLLINEWMINNNINTATSLTFDKAFNDMLYKAGYYDLVNKFIDDDYDKLLPLLQNEFTTLGLIGSSITFNKANLENIMAIKALDVDKFSIMSSTASRTLRESLTKYAISNYSEVAIMESLQEELKGTSLYKHSKTIADSSISEFNQAVINMKAAEYEGEKVYWYKGKRIDEKTRDFCKCVIRNNAYYTEDEAHRIEKNPKRKYNCRHRVVFGTLDYAKEYLGLEKNTGGVCS